MRDIAELRKFATTGISANAANRVMGRPNGFAERWARRYGIAFVPYGRRKPKKPRAPPRPPPSPAMAALAKARLMATMQSLSNGNKRAPAAR